MYIISFLIGTVIIALSNSVMAMDYRLEGKIDEVAFVKFKMEVEKNDSQFTDGNLIVNSVGGDMYSAMAFAKLLNRKHMGVVVDGICASACANYIFPAGAHKTILHEGFLGLHGGANQKNLRSQLLAVLKNRSTKGRYGFEGVVAARKDDKITENQLLVRNFIGAPRDCKSNSSRQFVDCTIRALVRFERAFYRDLGVNPQYPSLGQWGRYKKYYESYQYKGYTYPIKTFESLGVNNVHSTAENYPTEFLLHQYQGYLVE